MRFLVVGALLLLAGPAFAQVPNDPGPFVLQQTLTSSLIDTTYGSRPMRVHGNDAFVSGAAVVYVYRRVNEQWIEDPILFVSTDGSFGRSLDFDGTTLIVGGDGAAYLYQRVTVQWQNTTTLLPDVPTPGFGTSVSIDNGARRYRGGPERDDRRDARSSLSRSTASGHSTSTLQGARAGFGTFVAISGNTAGVVDTTKGSYHDAVRVHPPARLATLITSGRAATLFRRGGNRSRWRCPRAHTELDRSFH